MNPTTSRAQDVIICHLCDKPAQRFCNNCQANLCLGCVSKHIHDHESLGHDIVSFTNRKIRLVFNECEIHPGQRCEVHCQQCHTPVCVMCILGKHKNHEAVDLSSIVENKKKMIEEEIEEIEAKIVPKFKKRNAELNALIDTVKTEFTKMKEKNESLRKIWHQEVDDIFDKAGNLINSMQNLKIASITKHQNDIESKIPEMSQTVQQLKKVLKSNKASEINDLESKLKEYRDFQTDIEVDLPSLIEKTNKGKEIQIEIDSMKATLTQIYPSQQADDVPVQQADDAPYNSSTELLDKAKETATISTQYHQLWSVACVGTEVWISGFNGIISRVDMKGVVQETINVTNVQWPNDISMTKQGELIFSKSLDRTINIVRDGRIERLFTVPEGWEPCRLHCTRSGHILVSMHCGDKLKNKIVKYHMQTITHEIDRDENGKPIFYDGIFKLYVTENTNEDICVSDVNAYSLVVVDKTGRVRFRYDGTPAKTERFFDPRCLVTDSFGHIILTDNNNDCLHILDRNGQFLRCVDNCGLDRPFGLSVNNEGRLLVGLPTGKIKVIQYLK